MTIEPLLPSATHRLTSLRRVRIGDVVVGGNSIPSIAGPCAVEAGYVGHAVAARRAGASVLRGCVMKARTRPLVPRGSGSSRLPLLDSQRVTGLPRSRSHSTPMTSTSFAGTSTR